MPNNTPSTLTYNYSLMIYDEMNKSAVDVPPKELADYGYPSNETELVRTFTGTAVKLTSDLGLTGSTAQRCMSLLMAMRCISLIRPGGHGYPSIYILHYRPTEKQYAEYRKHVVGTNDKINPSRYQILLTHFTELRHRVNQQDIVIKDLSARVAYLESGRNV